MKEATVTVEEKVLVHASEKTEAGKVLNDPISVSVTGDGVSEIQPDNASFFASGNSVGDVIFNISVDGLTDVLTLHVVAPKVTQVDTTVDAPVLK